jgi:ribosomal protein L7Ae-like RNA K-turn-binding protein
LSASADVIHSAIKSGILSRAAKQRVTIPPEFLLLVTTALERRLIELLGLARRGGNAICGFEKAREWLQEQKAGLVVQAADGSADERARFCSGSAVKQVVLLDAARLGKIFGREQAVHVVIGAGRLAKMIENEADRLAAVAGRGRSGQ